MPDDMTFFGRIALSNGWIDEDALGRCLKAQRAQSGKKRLELGKIMVREGLLTAEQVEEVLAAQRRMRKSHVIKGYELLSKIGAGGMGTVYKARKEGIDKIVAIKILTPALARNRQFIERFFREARAAGLLNHPNIVAGFDVGESGGYYYFAMEYVEGRTVGRILADEGRMSEGRALEIATQVAQALEHAAANGLVHRDVKPDNIIVTPTGAAKLADLGLAKATSADASVTQAGHSIGTPHYSSPEQAKGRTDVDIRSDIYSLGATLYHMVAGRVPFAAGTSAAVLAKHITEELPPIFEMKSDFSQPVARLIKKMMAKDRNTRHASPAELLDDIRQTAHEIGKKHPKPQASAARPRTKRSRSTWQASVLGAVVAVLVIIGAAKLISSIRSGAGRKNNTGNVAAPNGDGDQSTEAEDLDPKPIDPGAARVSQGNKALNRADAFAREQHDAFELIIRKYEDVIARYDGTPAARAAPRRIKATLARRTKTAETELGKLQADTQRLKEESRFGEAIRRWEAYEARAKKLKVHERVPEEIGKLKQEAERALARMLAGADKMLTDGRFDEARALYLKIAENFGLKQAEEKARNELAGMGEREQAYKLKLAAEKRRARELRVKIRDVSELVGRFKIDEAGKTYEQLKRDCPAELLPLIEERKKDLALLAALKKKTIQHINAEPNETRSVKVRTGKRMTAASCKASDDGISLKLQEAEVAVGWDKLSAQTLNELAGSAAPEELISLALLAHYTGMHNTADNHLARAAEDWDLEDQATRLRKRFESETQSRTKFDIQQAIARAADLVRNKEDAKAQKALANLRQELADDGLEEEFGAEVAELVRQNNETFAEAELEKAIAESKRGNWRAVAKSIQVLKEKFGHTKTVKTTRAQDIAQLAQQCEKVVISKDMVLGIQHFVRMEDARARAIFNKVARENDGALVKDAAGFLRALGIEDNLPAGDCETLVRRVSEIPDPWHRISAYRTFRTRCPGSRSEAYARSRMGNVLFDELRRPVLAREIFLSLVNDFRKYDNWAAAGYVRLAQCEAACSNWAKAEEHHDTILKKYPDEQGYCTQVMRDKAEHHYSLGETEKAVRVLEKAIENYPLGGDHASNAQLLLAKIYRDDLNEPDKALGAFRQVYFRSAKHTYFAPVAMLGAADLLIKAGNTSEAKRYLLKVIDEFPKTAQAREAQEKLGRL